MTQDELNREFIEFMRSQNAINRDQLKLNRIVKGWLGILSDKLGFELPGNLVDREADVEFLRKFTSERVQ